MTIEEAIEIYTSNAEHERTHGSLQGCMDFKQLAEWLKELKAYKEQGDDTISRQAVLDAIYARYIGGKEAVDKAPASDHYAEGIDEAVCAVEDLPPVTPQLKTGHWIDDKCSVCGKGTEDLIASPEWYRDEEPNFCPFCGVKLLKPQAESEGT